jgi:ribonuclease J
MTRERIEAVGGDLIHIHTSSHAFVEDIQKLVGEIAPRKTVPVHTFEPEALRSQFDNVATICDGETLEV